MGGGKSGKRSKAFSIPREDLGAQASSQFWASGVQWQCNRCCCAARIYLCRQ
jgi:hypothetical protein